MKRLLLSVIFLSLLSIGQARAAQGPAKAMISGTLAITEGGGWRALQKGVEYRQIALERVEPNYLLDLKLLRLEPKLIGARVLSSGSFQLSAATAKVFAEKSGALAAINANYFDEKGRPLAYLKTAEREINRIVSQHALYTGVFALLEGLPAVLHRDEFASDKAGQALQSGPLLLNHGAPVEIVRGLRRYARRAIIGIDREGRVIVGVTDALAGGLSFVELQELFGNPKWQIDTPDLLNLDGGGSAQLYAKAGKFEQSIPGTSAVPVAIGFFVKAN
jgi:uncharacterized protein YigE (DUF2233 family)